MAAFTAYGKSRLDERHYVKHYEGTMNDTFRIDGQKLQFHPHRVAQWLDARGDWEKAKTLYPLYIEISPAGVCNHACNFCAIDFVLAENAKNKVAPLLDADIMAFRLPEMGALGVKSVMFAGEGEPLLHKRIDDMVMWSRMGGMDVAFTTNATLLHKLERVAQCTWIKASVNAGTEETYMRVHKAKKGDWERVWTNLAEAVKRKGSCTIGAQMVMLPENEHEVDEFQRRCADAGLDYGVVKPYSQHKYSLNKADWKPIAMPAAAGKLVVREVAAATTEHPYTKCSATPMLWAYLMASGDLYSCSAYLLDDRFNLGNLQYDTFQKVWEGEKRRANWEYVTKELDIHECRVNCRQARVNEYLSQFGNVPHVNFV